MFSVDLSTRECDGHVVVALRGELDLVDAADVAAALAAAVAREPRIIVDLAGLEFIDCSGVAALARGRRHARQGGPAARRAAAAGAAGCCDHPPGR
jgi:anti-anti-sigma factor